MKYSTKASIIAVIILLWNCEFSSAKDHAMRSGLSNAAGELEETMEFLENHVKQIDSVISRTLLQGHHDDTDQTVMGQSRTKPSASSPVAEGFVRREVPLHRNDSDLKINLVSFHHPEGSRRKRAVWNTTSGTWPNRIPYKFDPTYPVELIPHVKRILSEIMDNLCVEYVEEPNFDPNSNSYETNAYLNFYRSPSGSCNAPFGQGSGSGERNARVCSGYFLMIHEIMHTLGVLHEQQGPMSENYLVFNTKNIKAGVYEGNHKRKEPANKIVTSEFDPNSIMMYTPLSFSSNGFNAMYLYNEEQMEGGIMQLTNNYEELNRVYRCKERKCPNIADNCGVGYLTFVKGKCSCVCPDGFDTRYNCQKLEDKSSGPKTWPDVPFTLYATEMDSCPPGFNRTKIDVSTFRFPSFKADRLFTTGRTINYYMCTRHTSNTNADMDALPMGSYCVAKPKNQSCNGGFQEGGFSVEVDAPVTTSGEAYLPDWTVVNDNRTITMKFCCRDDKGPNTPIEFPRYSPFRVVGSLSRCPRVKGMRTKASYVVVRTANYAAYGKKPECVTGSKYFMYYFCSYSSPEYGCSEQISLNANNRQRTITTPGYQISARDKNRRCLYNFNVPKGARVKITINDYRIDGSDKFMIRKFNKWSQAFSGFNNRIKQFVSEKDFLFLEYLTGTSESSAMGINFTADVILPEDSCYDPATKGNLYRGQKAVSEDFEECLPWLDALECEDFTFNGTELVDLIASKNYCRNPGGQVLRPWCYVMLDRGNCKRSYCDVCNYVEDNDQFPNCQELMSTDDQFCEKSLQRFRCPKACNLRLNVPPPPRALNASKCGPPPVPYDGTPTQQLKSEYKLGEIVHVQCNLHQITEAPIAMECMPHHGWTKLDSACSECPPGWVPYIDRCFTFRPNAAFPNIAEQQCNSFGGNMFTIFNASDAQVLRKFKQTSSIPGAMGRSLLNILSQVPRKWVLQGDTMTEAPYLNWAPFTVTNNPNFGCAVMISEKNETGNAGKFTTVACNTTKAPFFCEIPRRRMCIDKLPNCKNALSIDPFFCTRPSTYPSASQLCQRSCGLCSSLFAEPESVDVGIRGVVARIKDTERKRAYLLDQDYYRIPFNGTITHWHYFAHSRGQLTFMIFRFNNDTQAYKRVRFNSFSVSRTDMRWTHPVDASDMIQVKQGDLVAMYSPNMEVSANTCDKTVVKLIALKYQDEDFLNSILIRDPTFPGTTCIFPSVGYRIVPDV